ncbi:unnamed protein product [Trifolium pratense]|uniref:Uncharacterized protein n=1 Tax=Trifolium pratense TaxID=57577 RepID=A0ACB0M702_TRIPR|nr:unnamed protein product [Trifolium pratense]
MFIENLIPYKKACFGDMYIPTVDDKVKEQIMSAPRASDQGERIIGLCGPDKRVDHSVETAIGIAERHQLFQKIVKATMNLAGSTSCMCFGNNKRMTTAQRALLVCAKMKELQTVLVVRYDFQGRLDLGEIGIPFGVDHNGCKIFLTSTSVEVLSEQMKVHELIQLSEI